MKQKSLSKDNKVKVCGEKSPYNGLSGIVYSILPNANSQGVLVRLPNEGGDIYVTYTPEELCYIPDEENPLYRLNDIVIVSLSKKYSDYTQLCRAKITNRYLVDKPNTDKVTVEYQVLLLEGRFTGSRYLSDQITIMGYPVPQKSIEDVLYDWIESCQLIYEKH